MSLKNINCYLPGTLQCWVIVFIITLVGGLGVGTAVTLFCLSIDYNITDLNPLVSYLLPLVPALVYVFYKGWRAARENEKGMESGMFCRIQEPVALSDSDFGKARPVLTYIGSALAILVLGFITEPLSSWIPMPESIRTVYEKMLTDGFWAFVTTVIAAPVIEEFLLRGVMERGLLRHTSPLNAILLSAFFFALIHMNPWQAVGAFIAGVFLGWIYWRTRSLWLCMFMHAVNNGSAFALQWLFPDLPAECTYKEVLDSYGNGIYSIVFVIFVFLFIVYIHRMDKRLTDRRTN